jgi:hypothetical protein
VIGLIEKLTHFRARSNTRFKKVFAAQSRLLQTTCFGVYSFKKLRNHLSKRVLSDSFIVANDIEKLNRFWRVHCI